MDTIAIILAALAGLCALPAIINLMVKIMPKRAMETLFKFAVFFVVAAVAFGIAANL